MVVPAEEHSYTASEDVEARLLLLRHHKTPFSKARFPTRLWFGSVGRERRHGWLISKKQWWMNETSNQTRVWLFGVYLQGGILYREMYMGGWNQKTIGHVNLTVSVGFDFSSSLGSTGLYLKHMPISPCIYYDIVPFFDFYVTFFIYMQMQLSPSDHVFCWNSYFI